ncbi:MAG: peptide deformylase [candidate division Zixibacteria bacterium]|nr:peptide deformylase [candidate division Zixibacteria bacterium]
MNKTTMAVLDLKYYGNPILRKVAKPVENIDGEIVKFAEDLIRTMQVNNGIGLAANQVGRDIRIYAVDPSVIDMSEEPFVLINPQIITTEGEQSGEEGCLSFPGLFETVARPERVIVEALGVNEKPVRIERDGLMARVLLHEYDHLEGKLFIDYFGLLKKQLVNKRLQKLKAGDLEVFR